MFRDHERLIAAPELHVRFHGDRVLRLEERIQELHDRDRLALCVSLGEVVAFEHPGDGVRRGEAEDRLHVHRLEPFGNAGALHLI